MDCPREWQNGEVDCEGCTQRMASSVLFAGVDESYLPRIQRSIEELLIKRGGYLYRCGDSGDHVFTIRSGLVKLIQYLPDGNRRIVRLMRGTDAAGLECLLDQPYQHDAVVVNEARVCRIPLSVMRELDRDNPGLTQEIMRRWQRALSEADAWLTELSTGSARQRVARLLLRLVNRDGESICDLFSREDIGAMLGITTETASRVIAEFRRNGLIADAGSERFRCDIEALQRLAAD